MVQKKRNQEKVVVTKICFYGSAKIEWKMCVMENKGSVAKMIKMRGNNSMLTFKTVFLLNILAPCWEIFRRLLYQEFFCWDDWNEGQQTYANFKAAHFVEYLSSMLMDFHETSKTGILLMRILKISCIRKTFCIVLCFLHSIFTHIHKYIHVCMLMCLATIFLCQMQSWNQCACYI